MPTSWPGPVVDSTQAHVAAPRRRAGRRTRTSARRPRAHAADVDRLPDGGGAPGAEPAQRVTDYLAGMTDRYCIRVFEALTVPESFAA